MIVFKRASIGGIIRVFASQPSERWFKRLPAVDDSQTSADRKGRLGKKLPTVAKKVITLRRVRLNVSLIPVSALVHCDPQTCILHQLGSMLLK
jgi:hypothetical protein